jgi:hypothetical protein
MVRTCTYTVQPYESRDGYCGFMRTPAPRAHGSRDRGAKGGEGWRVCAPARGRGGGDMPRIRGVAALSVSRRGPEPRRAPTAS